MSPAATWYFSNPVCFRICPLARLLRAMPSPSNAPSSAPVDASGFSVGDAVATLTYDGFAEWAVTPAKVALWVPRATQDIVPLLTSGLTASIGGWSSCCWNCMQEVDGRRHLCARSVTTISGWIVLFVRL